MSFTRMHTKVVFFALGVLVSCAVIATTRYADAQFGSRRLQPAAIGLKWSFVRKDVAGPGVAVVAAKCASTDEVVSGGYSFVGANDGSKVNVLSAYPDHFENAYVVYLSNGLSGSIVAYSYVGCASR